MTKTAILWDWNGTLLDDTEAALASLNIMLGRRGREPISMAFYRANFRFPSRPFYESIGIRVRDDEWNALALEYHQTYLRQPRALAKDARAALELARSAGARQVIVSALRQDLLERDIAQYGIGEFFAGLYGTDNLDGAAKISAARKAMSDLTSTERAAAESTERESEWSNAEGSIERPAAESTERESEWSNAEGAIERALLIGDSQHDREAADAVGAACILHSCGTYTRERLEPLGPVADSLTDAVRLALGLN